MQYNPQFSNLNDQNPEFRRAFQATKDAVDILVYLNSDITKAEENPDLAEGLQRSIRFATLQEGSDWVVYQEDSWGPFHRRDRHSSREEAVASMQHIAERYPGQVEFPTKEELEVQLNESPTDGVCYYEDLDHVVHVANKPDDRSRELLHCLWLVIPSTAIPGQWLLWGLDDGQGGLAFQGRYEMKQEALREIANQKEGMNQQDALLLSEAKEELAKAKKWLKAERPSRHEPSEARDRVTELEAAVKFLKASIRAEARSRR